VEFATLGEVRVQPGWEEPAWLDDEGLRQEWFREEASHAAAIPRTAGASATFRPATAAGRRAWDNLQRAARPPACAGARGTSAIRGGLRQPPRRERAGSVDPSPQPCLWHGR